jgi:thiol-disulfide isomerase/thioredoxin
MSLCQCVLADPITDGIVAASKSGKYVLVDFWADWCGWCKRMDVTLADPKVDALVHDNFVYVKLDVGQFDKYTDRLKQYNVTGIPVMLILDGQGKLLGQQVGYLPPEAFLVWEAKTMLVAGAKPVEPAAPTAVATQPAAAVPAQPTVVVKQSVDVALLAKYLGQMNLKFETATEKGYCHLFVDGEHATYEMYVLADTKASRASIVVRHYMTVAAADKNCDKVLRHLMGLNWKLDAGKFEWNPDDGEVGLALVLNTEGGLSFDAFKAAFDAVKGTADEKYPELQKALNGG